ncbi:molybdate ABC transporter substrate-binding protein [Geoalkalibacter sp.]|uniref:molybdate ABC transporter substrate-binding protein n=1 Tax=Geoalkalibacter sp. TaxID=3041440 RepID=UPI00272E951F|nr:molybdate ABC transporter substrate-binding protein [Geoalkalibacter sp.]
MKKSILLFCLLSLFSSPAWAAGDILIAAAADLQFAMDDVAKAFREEHPRIGVKVSYGSSGNFFTQIRQGAPFDLYFSADLKYTEMLEAEGFAATPPKLYAVGRIVLWTRKDSGLDPTRGLELVNDPAVRRFAIANPAHAPYGVRAREALMHYGHWDQVQPKLVFGENISQTAQFVQTGNAQAGILALSLAMAPALKDGHYYLIPEEAHLPLEQAFIVTRRARDNPAAKLFAEFVAGEQARAILAEYGFVLPTQPVQGQ